MKRVLNSGFIKLPYIARSERDIFAIINEQSYYKDFSLDEQIGQIVSSGSWLQLIEFTFEIKAPQLIIQSFQDAHLGSLKAHEVQDYQIGYLPPAFYSQAPSTYVPMDSKKCNDLSTRMDNFYNWSFNFYNKLIEQGVCPEQAALALPQGLFKTFLWEINAKDLIQFVEQNIHKSPEMYGYCSTLVLYLDEHLPKVTSYLKRNQWKDLI